MNEELDSKSDKAVIDDGLISENNDNRSKLLLYIGLTFVLFPVLFDLIIPGCPPAILGRILHFSDPEGAGTIIEWVMGLLGAIILANIVAKKINSVTLRVFAFIGLTIVLSFILFFISFFLTFSKCFTF